MTYEKRYTDAAHSAFEMWQIREDGSSRQIWNWEFREDYDPNTVIEIPYVAPQPPPEPIPPTLEELKAAKAAEIESAFSAELNIGCPIRLSVEKIFRIFCKQSDQNAFNSELALRHLAEKNGFPTDGDILTFDGTIKHLTLSEYEMMCLQFGAYVKGLMTKKWQLLYAANTAETADVLNLIVWT